MARILVVDDITDARQLLAKVLRYAGHEPLTAASGVEALEQVERSDPDLILLDISMPGMNGLEVLENLRQQGRVPRLPVIMLTAINDAHSRQRALALGARDYFVKAGFELAEMLERIERHVTGRGTSGASNN